MVYQALNCPACIAIFDVIEGRSNRYSRYKPCLSKLKYITAVTRSLNAQFKSCLDITYQKAHVKRVTFP